MQEAAANPSTDRLAEAIQNLADAVRSSGGLVPAAGDAGEAAAGEAGAAEAADAGADLTNVPLDFEGIQGWLAEAQKKLLEYLPSVFAAAAIVFVGWIVIRLIMAAVRKAFGKTKLDSTLVNFLCSVLQMLLLAFVLLSAIRKLGVDTTSFVAIIGAASFAVGFAMQGSLSNFAAGVMMMIFRPIREGDLVEAGGVLGVVQEVGVFATIINTLEEKRAIIANSTITDGNIINYTSNGRLRVDMTFGIGYGDDIDKAIAIMRGVLESDERVLKDPAPTVALFEHGDSSVNFVCRPYVSPEHYWDVWFDTHRSVKEAFDAQGVSIPFPQRDVHMIPQPS